jgi:DNA-damage-inducible protein J
MCTGVIIMANIRVDDKLKKEADKKFSLIGMSTNDGVNIFLTQFVRTGKFPFQIEVPTEQPNDETLAAFTETEQILSQNHSDNKERLTDYRRRMRQEVKDETDHVEL